MKPVHLMVRYFAAICLCSVMARAAEEEAPAQDPLRELAKQASSCRRKAMDYRVLSLNALKNADAEREEAHKGLVSAMTSGNTGGIRKARDKRDNAADELEDVIRQVEKAIQYSMKADMSARKAEELCKAPGGEAAAEKPDFDEIVDLVAESSKHLAKAEEIAHKLRRDWLEPVFASTTTTSSTTSTTKAQPDPEGK